jgi:hypothetical protein
MAVCKNIEVTIPKEHITIEKQKDGKPALIKYVLEAPYNRKKGYSEPKRTTIGHQCIGSTTRMHPTTQYKEIFPTEWEKISNEKIIPAVKRIGMFSACLAINTKVGIKDILDSVYGDDKANALMDYAAYSVIHHSDTTQMFASKMRNELLYSTNIHNESYYSRLFEQDMTTEQMLLFKEKWAKQCKEDGVEDVWLCIDGSNDDCTSTGVEIAGKGHAKSGRNTNIVSFTYAVTTEGKPVTFDVYQGGLVDAKEMRRIIDFLTECGFKLSGVILDRGYCDAIAIRYLVEQDIPYVIMVKGHPEGYESTVQTYGEAIKMNAEYLIEGTCLFGIQQKGQLFKGYKHEDYITLFFDYQNGSERVTALLKNIYEAKSKAEKALHAGNNSGIEKKYTDMLSIEQEEGNQDVARVVINTKGLQKAIDEKGLYSIITSDPMPPARVHQLYVNRSASETQYRMIKSQLGYGTIRVHDTAGVLAKFTIGFISSIIRYEIEQASKPLNRTANQMIQDIDRIEMQKLNGIYTCTHVESERIKDFFKNLKEDAGTIIDESVKLENDRIAGRTVAPRHRKTGPKKGSHHKKYDESGTVIKPKPGIAAGTKRSDTNLDGTVRKKPGVKEGTVRDKYNKDGNLRKKPGPQKGTHYKKRGGDLEN